MKLLGVALAGLLMPGAAGIAPGAGPAVRDRTPESSAGQVSGPSVRRLSVPMGKGRKVVLPGVPARRYWGERRRLRRWLASLRIEIGELDRLAAESDSENELQDFRALARERRAEIGLLLRRLAWLKRRLVGMNR